MNILFFLTPKSDVAYIYDNYSLRQVLEKMEYHKYSCIPVIGVDGKYVGTITEGDLLWGLKERGAFDLKKAEEVPIRSFERRMDYAPVRIDSDMEDLLDKAYYDVYGICRQKIKDRIEKSIYGNSRLTT